MTPKTETRAGLPTADRSGHRTVDAGTRLVAAVDPVVVVTALVAALAVAYGTVLVPAELLALVAGFAAAVTLASALPFVVVRAATATLTRHE